MWSQLGPIETFRVWRVTLKKSSKKTVKKPFIALQIHFISLQIHFIAFHTITFKSLAISEFLLIFKIEKNLMKKENRKYGCPKFLND